MALRSLFLGPLFKKGGKYSLRVEAIDAKGKVINESKKAKFTIGAEELEEPLNREKELNDVL